MSEGRHTSTHTVITLRLLLLFWLRRLAAEIIYCSFNTVKNKVVEGTHTAIDSVSRVFENEWQKFLSVFHKFKWALLAIFIIIVVTVALGILHKLGLSQPIVKYVDKFIWILIKFIAKLLWFGVKLIWQLMRVVCHISLYPCWRKVRRWAQRSTRTNDLSLDLQEMNRLMWIIYDCFPVEDH